MPRIPVPNRASDPGSGTVPLEQPQPIVPVALPLKPVVEPVSPMKPVHPPFVLGNGLSFAEKVVLSFELAFSKSARLSPVPAMVMTMSVNPVLLPEPPVTLLVIKPKPSKLPNPPGMVHVAPPIAVQVVTDSLEIEPVVTF